MKSKVTLSQYVKRRNGIRLGGAGSLTNMLHRSLGAGSFSHFWQHWNPIWGYYLARFVFSPLKQWFPINIAIILTFSLSGLVHDIAVSILKFEFVFIITPWFLLMGATSVLLDLLKMNYHKLNWYLRAIINISIVIVNYLLSICFL